MTRRNRLHVGFLSISYFLAVCSTMAAIPVGTGPTFTHRYSPREARGLDPKAVYQGLKYLRESPERMNCSFIIPSGETPLSSGTMSYVFQPASGYTVEHVVTMQSVTLFTAGNVRGEYSADDGLNWRQFYTIAPYAGNPFGYARQGNLRNVLATNLTLRYTLTLTNGFNFSVQFERDCDDNMNAFAVSGTVIGQKEAERRLVLIPAGATWKYLDNGANAGTAWRSPDYDDQTWSTGRAEFGYGDGDEATKIKYGSDANNKYVTTYFRHSFQVSNPAALEGLRVGLLFDDGVVVYLNGSEVFRRNLSEGQLDYRSYAIIALGDPDEMSFEETFISPEMLVPGTNVLAVEVHQATAQSSDLSFDFDLVGIVAAPELSIIQANDQVALSWTQAGFMLESADHIEGPWQEVAGEPVSPYQIGKGLLRSFYRLKQKP